MTSIKLPALVGDSPLAILAAIGTLRLIREYADGDARLSWDPQDWVPVLDSRLSSVEEVVQELADVVDGMPDGVLVPGGPAGFPPPGVAPDKLRVQQGQLGVLVRTLTREVSPAEAAVVLSWIGCLVTDLVADSSGRGAISQFTAPFGKQSMATMLEKPLELVRGEPDYLRQALAGWRRVAGVTGEYLDHRASWDAGEDGRGKAQMRGVPGATWLALMSYPLWTTTATVKQPRSSGWHSVRQGRRRPVQELRLPLWQEPLGLDAVRALVEHPLLDGDWDDIDEGALRLIGVFHVCRARRRQAAAGKSAGVLALVS